MRKLSHVDAAGKARMVDVSGKPVERRTARASGRIRLSAEARRQIAVHAMKKGNALCVAQVAGIQAAKQTAALIPLCHPLRLDHIAVRLAVTSKGVSAESTVSCAGPTGVEMEALTAVSVALLTVYDMCKAVDKAMVIEDVRLLEKVKSHV
jgi:cyclic pyranopterin monophosphate synthase